MKILQVVLIAGAAAAATVPIPPGLVERLYSNGAYPLIQPAVTSFSNLFPFAGFDVLVGGLVLLWALLAVRDFQAGSRECAPPRLANRHADAGLGRVLVPPLSNHVGSQLPSCAPPGKVGVQRRNRSPWTARERWPSASLNRSTSCMVRRTPRDGARPMRSIPSLAAALERAVHEVGGRHRVEVARPKRTVLDWYFRRAAVSGMTDPFLLETLVASDVLPFERPFVVAHEWSHVAGIADEGEANFVAWLACVRGSASHRYSGWLMLYEELLPSVGREDRAAIAAALAAGPREDLRAGRERLLRNVNPRLSAAGWRFYDSFLKANRVESGAASYAEVVRLVLGVRFGPEWTADGLPIQGRGRDARRRSRRSFL